jgi:hypothetical protein
MVIACGLAFADVPDAGRPPGQQVGPEPKLPEPFQTQSVNNPPKVIGWPDGRTPVAPEGFKVRKFAAGLENPRCVAGQRP